MAKTANTKFVARLAGEVVGTRRSPRPYVAAVVVENVEAEARARAYAACAYDAQNYEYDLWVATAPAGSAYPKPGYNFFHKYTAEEVSKAQAMVEGGREAYVERNRQKRIAGFEENVAKGYYGKPYVHGWSTSAHNAQKMAAPFQGGQYTRLVAIVPAEVA